MNFGMWGDIAELITHAEFYVNRFGDLGVLTPPNLHYAIGLAGRSYNSVNLAVLHCGSFKTVFFV